VKEKEMKQVRPIAMMITLMASLAVSVAAYAQLPASSTVLPAGFKVETERNLGGSMIINAKKPNESFPKPHMDQGIGLEISWTRQPMAGQVLDMIAKQPEDPARQNPGSATREEPCGRQPYRDGVLSCRKVITPWIGGGSGPDLVTWRIGWTGKGKDGLVGVGVNNLYGSKETAMGWIDAIIPKITNPKQ
jgi:hypothetical protein